jgi:hypothetical protein
MDVRHKLSQITATKCPVMSCTYQNDGPGKLQLPTANEIFTRSWIVDNVVLHRNDSELDALFTHKCYLPSGHGYLISVGAGAMTPVE